jgi:hypothetical protein
MIIKLSPVDNPQSIGIIENVLAKYPERYTVPRDVVVAALKALWEDLEPEAGTNGQEKQKYQPQCLGMGAFR